MIKWVYFFLFFFSFFYYDKFHLHILQYINVSISDTIERCVDKINFNKFKTFFFISEVNGHNFIENKVTLSSVSHYFQQIYRNTFINLKCIFNTSNLISSLNARWVITFANISYYYKFITQTGKKHYIPLMRKSDFSQPTIKKIEQLIYDEISLAN